MLDGKYQILHVEDDKSRFQNYCYMINGALDARGIAHTIIWAGSIENACRQIMTHCDELDLIILDISMDDKFGDTGLSIIRAVEKAGRIIPMFVVSANVEIYQETLKEYKEKQLILGYSEPLNSTWPKQIAEILLGRDVSVLHLSDIHDGKFFALGNLELSQNKILDDLCDKLGHVDFVVVSGDISSTNDPNDYHEVCMLLDNLRAKLSLEPKDFVFVPGNHDRDLSRNDAHTFSNFLTFLKNFYRGQFQPDSYYPSEELEDYDEGAQTFSELISVVVYPQHRTIVIGLNSVNPLDITNNRKKVCSVRTEEMLCGLTFGGAISSEQLINARHQLEALYVQHPDYKTFVKMSIFHHNIFEAAHVERTVWRPTILNQGNVLDMLAELDSLFIFHGHLHYSELYYYKTQSKPHGMNIISAGTFSGKDRHMDPNFCANKISYRVSYGGQVLSCKIKRLLLPKDSISWKSEEIILNDWQLHKQI